jgi:hypothetical protein
MGLANGVLFQGFPVCVNVLTGVKLLIVSHMKHQAIIFLMTCFCDFDDVGVAR